MRHAIGMLAVGAIAMGLVLAGANAQSKSSSAFDRLKALAGEWQSTDSRGEVFTSAIRLVSSGTAIEETVHNTTVHLGLLTSLFLRAQSEDNLMVTLYSPDGNRIAMTHYCSAGNQPRMETNPVTADQKEFDFAFVGITNLTSPESGHMRHLVIEITDNNHFVEQWTWRENGKDQTGRFHFTRTK